ncbi:hypothetical protein MBLNU459_g0419t1 [Dothideomycetes sp. NU459]
MATLDLKEVIDDGTVSALVARYNNLKVLDGRRDALVEELFARYSMVAEQLTQERADVDRERIWVQENDEVMKQSINHLQKLLNSNPFILVLIDGEDLIFRNSFLRDGDVGGRRVAQLFHKTINEFVFSSINDLPVDVKIVVRMFIDMDTLTQTFLKAGIVDAPVKLKSFVRGFNQDKNLFDIIDVGNFGRETIIDKVEENLEMHTYNFQCRQIILGCSDHEIYPRVLKKVSADKACHSRIVLLSGTPLDKDFAALPFLTTSMGTIFRNTKIDKHGAIDYLPQYEPSVSDLADAALGPGLMTPPSSTPPYSSLSHSRLDHASSLTSYASHLRKTSVESSANCSDPALPKSATWASTAKKVAGLPVTTAARLPEKDLGIRRNKKGQRLDPPTTEFRKDEVDRLKKMKLCNSYYLRNDCPYKDEVCTHDHCYKPTKSEFETLKLVARMSACIYDSACDDPKCIYGHRCPFPAATLGSMRGRGCINGEKCRFPAHMHAMDNVPVKVTKIN